MGSFYSETEDLHGISRSSVSRAFSSVIGSINRLLDNIHFPKTEIETARMKMNFFQHSR